MKKVKLVSFKPLKFLQIGKGYKGIYDIKHFNGNIYFIGIRGKRKCVLVINGKEVKKYDFIENLNIVNGKPACDVEKDHKRFVFYNDKELGKQYDLASNVIGIGRKIAYLAKKNNKKFVVLDERKVGREYENNVDINNFISLGNTYAFAFSSENEGRQYIDYGGKIIGKEYMGVYRPMNTGGKLAFWAYTQNEKYQDLHFLVYKDKEFETNGTPRELSNPIKIGDDYAFLVELEGEELKRFIIYDRKEIGKEYEDVKDDIIDIEGKPAFMAKRGDRWLVVFDGKEIGKEFDDVCSLFNLKGKLVFIAEKDEKLFLILYTPDGLEIGMQYESMGYESVDNPVIIDGNIVWSVKRKGKKFLLYKGYLIGEGYDNFKDMQDTNGKLTFIAIKGKKEFLLIEK